MAGPMRDGIPTSRLRAAMRAHAESGDGRQWHELSAAEQQWWVDRTRKT